MVYRGKPSAGCENCRKAKKRCDLEQPACSRCVKLKKTCGGYRDISQLQIQDESQSVILKANRQKPRSATVPEAVRAGARTKFEHGIISPGTSVPPSPREGDPLSNDAQTALYHEDDRSPVLLDLDPATSGSLDNGHDSLPIFTMKPSPGDLGRMYFFSHFTATHGHWAFLRAYEQKVNLGPALEYAMQACGLAALDNIRGVELGRSYSFKLYSQALSLLNAALRDPKQCKTDDSLIVVHMLGYFENITCDSRLSIQSWKAHIRGATQLLKLRGKGQFAGPVGRTLFRETRSQILVDAIWDEMEPPAFLMEWNDELLSHGDSNMYWFVAPADEFTILVADFARLRCKVRLGTLPLTEALDAVNNLEMKMEKWALDLSTENPFWRYREVEVPDRPEIWNGIAHVYNMHQTATVWNTYRNIRIMLSRNQELLMRTLNFDEERLETQMRYLRSVRRRMTDEICMGIPSQLGHGPSNNSQNVLVTAYNSIWPLFFAGTCALERIGPGLWCTVLQQMTPSVEANTSAALTQAMWIIGRMEYISRGVGLRWAEGVLATLRGDFAMHEELLPQHGEADSRYVQTFWRERLKQIRMQQVPEWIEKMRKAGRSPKMITMEENAPLSTGILTGLYPDGLWKGDIKVDDSKTYRANGMDISDFLNG